MSATMTRRLLIGVGNAGVSVLDRIAVQHPKLKGMLVINNDLESLTASVVTERIEFACPEGGDLTDGFLALEEEFAQAISGAVSVTLCGALGGEIGSFLLPALAARAKAEGITTLASVGIPFSFEGRQKGELASTALQKLYGICDAVAVIDNDRLSAGVPSTAAIGDAFVEADKALQYSLLTLQGMLSTSGPVKISRADLAAVLGHQGAMTHFAYGCASGDNRLYEALEAALKSPLFTIPGKGLALKEASTLLLLLSGPTDLSFAEVQCAVSELERRAGERCQIKVGVQTGMSAGMPLELALFASSGGSREQMAKKSIQSVESHSNTATAPRKEETYSLGDERSVRSKQSRETKTTTPMKSSTIKQTQGVFDLQGYQRGRFDKSEPTIVNGDDLDIPTYLRKGIKLTTLSK